jgi:hypothetical protein
MARAHASRDFEGGCVWPKAIVWETSARWNSRGGRELPGFELWPAFWQGRLPLRRKCPIPGLGRTIKRAISQWRGRVASGTGRNSRACPSHGFRSYFSAGLDGDELCVGNLRDQPAMLSTSACGATKVVGQSRLADAPCQNHAADAQGDDCERTVALPRLV